MSKYSEFIKGQKEKDMKFFFGEDYKKTSNKYFKFKRVIDEDNIILITNNIKVIKGNYVLIVWDNKGVYLKDWQVRKVHNYYNDIVAYAVKLNRKYFKPYEFKFEFNDFVFEKESTFDSLYEVAKIQEEENMEFALGDMG